MVRCWKRHVLEIRADLAAAQASGSPDDEVLMYDIRVAERQLAALIALTLDERVAA